MKKKFFTVTTLLMVMILLVLTASGCSEKKQEYTEDELYHVYYKKADGNGLDSIVVGSHMDQPETIVADLLAQMQTQIVDNPDLVPAIPQSLKIETDANTPPYLVVNFDKEYLNLSPMDELLCRAAITLTLTQIKGIHYVEIMADGSTLKTSDDKEILRQSDSNFITDDYVRLGDEKQNVILYFVDSSTQLLEPKERTVLTKGTVTPEQVILEELIEGPAKMSTLKPVLSSDVKILNHSIKNGTCYVNFDQSFLKNGTGEKPELVIYGIVNSLCELKEVSKVQFLVEGKSDVKFANEISLADPFSRNGSLVLTTD